MVNEYKRIVLLTGLMDITDHEFKMVKALLRKELKLNKMQDKYDRVKIADLMEDKFPKDAGLDQLIKLYKEIPGLRNIADTLKKAKAKGKFACNPFFNSSKFVLTPQCSYLTRPIMVCASGWQHSGCQNNDILQNVLLKKNLDVFGVEYLWGHSEN